MPSTSDKQKEFMKKACEDPKFAERNKIDQTVACEFHNADLKIEKQKQSNKKQK